MVSLEPLSPGCDREIATPHQPPIAPEAPVNFGLIRALGYARALIAHFRKLGEAETS